MFGLEILDVVIGLMFVYLLLSLLATAINEYISAVMNLRGKELARGLGRLLDDLDEKDALQQAFDGVGTKATTAAASLTERFYNHRLIRPLATRQGWIAREDWKFWRRGHGLWRRSSEPRLPSYIPARTFALALLDVLGVDQKDANIWKAVDDAREIASKVAQQAAKGLVAAKTEAQRIAAVTAEDAKNATQTAQTSGTPQDAAAAAQARRKAQTASEIAKAVEKATTPDEVADIINAVAARVPLVQVLEVLKRESPFDVKEHLANLDKLLTQTALPADVRTQFVSTLTGAQTQLQQLHDSVEVWFNNSMDRVSGAYKRTVQGWLFIIGILIASCSNADTIDMWRRLKADDGLRAAMVRRAEATVAALDTTLADSVAAARTVAGAPSSPQPTTPAPAQTDSPRVTLASPGAGGAGADTARSAGTGTAGDSAKLAAVKQARANYLAHRTRLDSMELKLGWTRDEAVSARFLRRDSTGVYPKPGAWLPRRVLTWAEKRFTPAGHHADLFPFDTRQNWGKLLGLLLTAIAISLGAPFWFDLLNKVISIRAAGRAPDEKPKSPEGGPKRAAEHTPL